MKKKRARLERTFFPHYLCVLFRPRKKEFASFFENITKNTFFCLYKKKSPKVRALRLLKRVR